MEKSPNKQVNNQQRQRQSIQNSNTRTGNNKSSERNKRYSQGQGRNPVNEGNNVLKVQQGNKKRPLDQDRMKGHDNVKTAPKGRDQNLTEKQDTKHVTFHQNKSNKSNSGATPGGNPRYGRNTPRNPGRRNETLRKSITAPKRIETLEDIQAEIERIDKDIQFEIKQIRAVKLSV